MNKPVVGNEELKPCPFCGSAADVDTADDEQIHPYYFCPNGNCPVSDSSFTFQQWNTRASAPVQGDVIEADGFEYQTLPDGTKAPICPECKHAGDLNKNGVCQTESYHRDFSEWQPCRHKCNVPSTSQADVISRAEALAIPEAWESSDACNGHSDNPCCHVRTAAAIAERIAALPATSIQATPDARERARELVNTWAEDNNVVRIGSYWQELESAIAEALSGCMIKSERMEVTECIRGLSALLAAERKARKEIK